MYLGVWKMRLSINTTFTVFVCRCKSGATDADSACFSSATLIDPSPSGSVLKINPRRDVIEATTGGSYGNAGGLAVEPHFVTDVTEVRANPVVSRRGHLLVKEIDRWLHRRRDSSGSSDDDNCETPSTSPTVTPASTSAAIHSSGWSKKWVVSVTISSKRYGKACHANVAASWLYGCKDET